MYLDEGYSLLIRYSFILGSNNVDFLAARVEITNQPKSKRDGWDFMYHKFL
jgi:hypothetical protein